MVDFDEAARGEANGNLDEMWSIISAIGLWVNVEDISELLSTVAAPIATIALADKADRQ